jgi:hypothetical protein
VYVNRELEAVLDQYGRDFLHAGGSPLRLELLIACGQSIAQRLQLGLQFRPL